MNSVASSPSRIIHWIERGGTVNEGIWRIKTAIDENWDEQFSIYLIINIYLKNWLKYDIFMN